MFCLPGILYLLIYVILIVTFWGWYHYSSHFIEEKTEEQRVLKTCKGHLTGKYQDQDLHLDNIPPKSMVILPSVLI